jgi:capsular polysaccharide biosynthesis protein
MGDLVMSGNGSGRYGAGLPTDEPIEVGRYLGALRRSWLLILLIVVPLTAVVLLVSLSLSPSYRATAKIVVESGADPLESRDVQSVERRLATIKSLLTTRENLRRAARRVRGERAITLEDKVQASVDPSANIINVVATDDTARGAARVANAVATTFLATERRAERRRLNRARATLLRALAALEGVRGLQAQEERAAIRERLTDFNFGAANAGAELELAEAARPPSEAYAPRPVRNAIFAFFASMFVAVLVVLARDGLARARPAPRPAGARRDPIRPPPLRPWAEAAEGGRVRGLPDAPGVAAPAAPCHAPAHRARDERTARGGEDRSHRGAGARALARRPPHVADLRRHALAATS